MSELVAGGDLDAITTVGEEASPVATGVPRADVEALWGSVQSWYRMGTTPAIQVCLRRRGAIVLNRAIGDVTPASPFCGFSTAKGVSATLMFMLIEQGVFTLNDTVARHIPEFAARGKAAITIGDVLSHSAGVPFMTPPYRGFDVVVDEELAVEALADLRPSWPPGRFRVYHALTSGLIQRLLVQRATGKTMREHLDEQVLNPLGFRWTNFGVAPQDVQKVVPSVKTGPDPSWVWTFLARKALGGGMGGAMSQEKLTRFLTAELPSGNIVTTAEELSRFYEILTCGGELDGVRIIGADALADAVRSAPRLPGAAGRVSRAGFELGGRRDKRGRHTESHFGRSGLTTQYGWSDPARALSGAILTSGKATTDTRRPWQLLTQIAAVSPVL